jgi:5'-nucleotidase
MGANRVPIVAGGAAYLAAHVARLRVGHEHTIVVSSGDLTGASPLVSNLFFDEPTVQVMGLLGLDIEGVGNHDLDRGLPELLRLQNGGPRPPGPKGIDVSTLPPFGGARYEYLGANVRGADGKTVLPPYAIKDIGGVKVAFLGMTLEGTASMLTKEAKAGLSFANEAATANALLPELRRQGVLTTILLVHQGGFQGEGGTYDSCNGLGGDILHVLRDLDPSFRVVLTAHTHQAYRCMIGSRSVTSAASYGRLVTVLDLSLDAKTGELEDLHAENVAVTRDIPPDPKVASLVDEYESRARPVTDRVVGYLKATLLRDPKAAHSPSCETPLGDVIADAELAATARSGASVAFMNPGGVRTDLMAVGGTTSPIHYGDAFEVQPFGNALLTLSLTGSQLLAVLEHQFAGERPRVLSVSTGFHYAYHVDRATRTVTIDRASIRLRGKVLEPSRVYRVTVSSFLADGGDGFSVFRDATERTPGPIDIDAFVAYLEKSTEKSPLAAPKLERVLGDACE